MEIIVCDRCKQEVERMGRLPVLCEVQTFEDWRHRVFGRLKKFQLCVSCFHDLQDFLSGVSRPN